MPDREEALRAAREGECLRLAGLALKAGDREKAARYFLDAGEAETAAILFEKLGQLDGLGEAYLASGRKREAAAAFARGGEPRRAAELFLEMGSDRDAAEAFESAGELLRAAEVYARLGEPSRAAELLAESGRFLEAARKASDANDEKAMIGYLQKVPGSAPEHRDAVVILAKALNRRGWSSLAVEKLEALLGSEPVRDDNLELWYQLAAAHEQLGELEITSSILHDVVACRYDYREAESWHRRIQKELVLLRERKERIARASRDEERYVLGEALGEGGMGKVYRARDRLLERDVAYKVLPGELSRDEEALERLLDEARAAASLNHPNIVTVHDVGVEAGRAFIAMELIEGESYKDLLKRSGRLPIQDVLHFLVSVCQGLEHAHRRGVVHQDLKPANVLLTSEGRVKIVDFGIARRRGGEAKGYVAGTLRYVAPEQVAGRHTDARSDLYALGVTLYELLLGHPPFTTGDIAQHHRETPPAPLRPARPEVPEQIEAVVLRCLEKDPSRRFASAREVGSAATPDGLR